MEPYFQSGLEYYIDTKIPNINGKFWEINSQCNNNVRYLGNNTGSKSLFSINSFRTPISIEIRNLWEKLIARAQFYSIIVDMKNNNLISGIITRYYRQYD